MKRAGRSGGGNEESGEKWGGGNEESGKKGGE